MKRYDVVAVGRAYTDIIAYVGRAFLEKYGIPADGDREFEVDQIKLIQADLPSPKMFAGGPSGNTVSVISALGGKAGFFGKVNTDEAGSFFINDLREREVDFLGERITRTPDISPICLVLETEGGERSFAYNPGCANNFIEEDFRQFDFGTTNFFLIEAHLLTSQRSRSCIQEAISLNRLSRDSAKLVVNLQGITSWSRFSAIAKYIIDNADIIIGNAAEQSAFADWGVSLSPNILRVATKGENGVEALIGKQQYKAPAVPPKAFKGATGAGDAFTAGLLVAQSRNENIPESLECGARAATAIIEEESGRPAIKTPGFLAHLIK